MNARAIVRDAFLGVRFGAGDVTMNSEGIIGPYGYVGGNPVSRIDPMGLAQCDVDDMVALARESNPDMNIPTPNMEAIPIVNGRTDAGYVGNWPFAAPVINSNLYGGVLSPLQRVDLYDTIVHESWHADKQSFITRGLGGRFESEASTQAAERTAKVREKILNSGTGSCGCKK